MKRGAPFRAVLGSEGSPLPLHQPPGDGQAEPCAAPLGGEERLEDAFDIGWRNAGALIEDGEADELRAGLAGEGDLEVDGANAGDGNPGILRQVRDYLFNVL